MQMPGILKGKHTEQVIGELFFALKIRIPFYLTQINSQGKKFMPAHNNVKQNHL